MNIENASKYFDSLGDLHDSKIMDIHYAEDKKQLAITVDDLNKNFLGLPEYPGKQPAKIKFDGVYSCNSVDDLKVPASIYALEINGGASSEDLIVTINIIPSGSVIFKCVSVDVCF